jgi:IS5 family transposase
VISANVAYPTGSGLLAKAVGKLVPTVRRVKGAGGATGTAMADWRRAAAWGGEIAAKLRMRGEADACTEHPCDRPGWPASSRA